MAVRRHGASARMGSASSAASITGDLPQPDDVCTQPSAGSAGDLRSTAHSHHRRPNLGPPRRRGHASGSTPRSALDHDCLGVRLRVRDRRPAGLPRRGRSSRPCWPQTDGRGDGPHRAVITEGACASALRLEPARGEASPRMCTCTGPCIARRTAADEPHPCPDPPGPSTWDVGVGHVGGPLAGGPRVRSGQGAAGRSSRTSAARRADCIQLGVTLDTNVAVNKTQRVDPRPRLDATWHRPRERPDNLLRDRPSSLGRGFGGFQARRQRAGRSQTQLRRAEVRRVVTGRHESKAASPSGTASSPAARRSRPRRRWRDVAAIGGG